MAASGRTLIDVLPTWYSQLKGWASSARMSAAAQEALQLDREPKALQDLVSQWSAGNFQAIPEVVLLSNRDINGALGAYAQSTGKIYLNADWINTATQEAINAVLTEELGHHLDGLLNAVDTLGDEGEYFSDLLLGGVLTDTQKAVLRAENDLGAVNVDGNILRAEFAGLLTTSAANLVVNGDFEATRVTSSSPHYNPATGEGYLIDHIPQGWSLVYGSGVDLLNDVHSKFGLVRTTYGQYVELDGRMNTGIEQSVATDTGKTYRLSFDWALPSYQGNTYSFPDYSSKFDVVINGIVAFSYDGTYGNRNAWTRQDIYYQSDSSTTTIQFLEKGNSDAEGTLLDNISLVAAPVIRGNSLYSIVNGPSWTQAEANSVSLGGHLLTVNTQQEQQFISSNVAGSVDLWIGLTDADVEGIWKWINGDSIAYANWQPGNPSNTNEEDYGIMYGSVHTWNDGSMLRSFLSGIAEIPLSLSITRQGEVKEGAGVFTTSINLSAGTQASANLAEGAQVWWTVTGITADDLVSGALSGNGIITNGKLDIQHSLKVDGDIGENFEVSVFSDASMTSEYQIGTKSSVAISENIVIRGNSIYRIVDGPSWTQAEANSVKLGGHLVTVNDAAENEWLAESYASFGQRYNGTEKWLLNAWIGFTDSANEGEWKWSSGENSSFTGWGPGEPSDSSLPAETPYELTDRTEDFAHIILPDVGGWRYDFGVYWNSAYNRAHMLHGGSTPEINGIAETPFIRRGDSAYVIVQGPTWEEAEANAVKLGGHLVTINDAEENEWIARTFGLRDDLAHWDHSDPDDVYFWIGLHDIDYDGTYQWSSDEPLLFTNWQPGNPYAVREDIYIAYGEIGYTADGKWNNISYNLFHSSQIGIAEIKLAPNNTPTGTPTLSGTFKAGKVIGIDKTSIQDADNFTGYTPDYNYSFEVSNDNGVTWIKLTSADATDNNSTYTLTAAEVGKKVRGVVSYVDGYGTNEVVPTAGSSGIVVHGNSSPAGGGFLTLNESTHNFPVYYVVINDSPSLSISGEYTVSSWVYRSDAGGDWRNLYDIPDAHLLEFDPDGRFNWRAENNNIDIYAGRQSVPDEEWHHILATIRQSQNGYEANIYLDGQLATDILFDNSTGVRDSNENLYLGILWSQRYGNPDPWAGSIDEFKIWNTALSATEIQAVASNDPSVRRQNLVAEYTFNSDTATTVFDSSGHNNNGTILSFVPNNAPTGTPTLSGIFKAGQIISIDKSPIQDVDNFTRYTPDYNYSFEVSGDSGITWTKLTTTDATDNNTTYTLTTAEVGKKVRGVVSYVDGYGTNEVVNSATVDVVDSSPTPTTPVISVIATANGKEADGSPVVFSFSRTGSTDAALSVAYQLFGTAQSGSDYIGGTTGTISFAAGSAYATLSLPALADGALIDPGETIIARINPSGSYSITPGKQFATATIIAEGMLVSPKASTLPFRGGGEAPNHHAFAALKSDGSVVAWGLPSYGGTAPTGLSGVTQIFSTGYAFAALKSDGSVVTWGEPSLGGTAPTGLSNVTQIFSNERAFAALKSDGSVITWGESRYGGTAPTGLSGVTQIFSNDLAFAALKSDGSVVTWGESSYGGTAPTGLSGVTQIFSTHNAFAALKSDGSVESWGNSSYGGTTPQGLSGVTQIFSNYNAFAALKSDGTVVAWGKDWAGGTAPTGLSDVTQIFSSGAAFAALKSDGSVVAWGELSNISNSGSAPAGLSGVTQIFSNYSAFAALKSDGTVVTWGNSISGGTAPTGLSGVTKIFSTFEAFAALKSDGSVVTWGLSGAGGTAPTGLSGVIQIFSNDYAFAALKSDGSVVTWGLSDHGGTAPTGLSGVVGFANPYTDDWLTVGTAADQTPTISLAVSPATAAEDGATNLVYTFTRTGPTASALTVNYGIGGTADSSDYTGATPGTSKTITFAAGASTATLTIDPTADSVVEAVETVALTLATGTGYTVGTTAAVVGTITNDDLPSITLAVSPTSVAEDSATNLIYTFTRTGPTASALTVNYGINGTAGNSDYTGATPGSSKTIIFAAGSSTATLTIDPTADSTVEYDETVALTLATGIGYTVGTNAAVVGTITNDDSVVTLEVSPATVIEDGAAKLVYTFTRTGFTADALTVNYTVGGTAFLGTDFTGIATPGTTKSVTFAAGAATAIVTVDPTVDSIVETNETVEFTLAAGTGYTVGTRSAVVGTITNDDSTVTLAVSSARVTENGSTNLVYTFTRTGFTNNALTVNYTIVGTADSSDYTGATPGTDKTITFAAGSTTATLTIDPSPDTVDEPDETVVVTLAEGVGYTVGTPAAVTGVIVNVPVLPTITLTVSTAAVKEDGAANLVYTFTRTGSTTNALTVNYGINGTADNSDYTGATPGSSKTIIFAAGSSTATLTIDPTADSTVEYDETVALTLATGTGYTVGTNAAVVGTITNDDSVVTLEVSPATVIEDGAANLVYTFTRTGFAADVLTVNYMVGGTAFLGTDYTGIATPGTTKTVTFAAGAATAIVTVDPTVDSIVETNETVELTLAAGTGYTVGTRSAVVGTITNDDSTVTLAVSPARVTENGSTNLVYTFTRTGFTNNALTVNYTIVGTADSSDYTGATPGTDKMITFAAGSTTATLTIDPSPDTVDEPDETVVVTLAEGSGYTVGTPAAVTGVIVNVPVLPTITLTVSPAAVKEDGAANLVYTFTRTGPTASALTVNYGINGTAGNSDYTGAIPGSSKMITFAAGSSTATLTIDPTADSTVEYDETVALTLATGIGYTVGTNAAVVGTITNDDSVVTLAVSPTSAAEDGTANLVYTFTRTGFTADALTVNYTVGGTAFLGTDFTGIATPGTTKTVTFAAGAATAIVTVDPTADSIVESDETVEFTLAAGTGYTVGTRSAVVGTITNDDSTVTLAVSPARVTENGSTNLVYTFTRTGFTNNALTVNYHFAGTADSSDYTGATPGTDKMITFAAGSTTAALTIDPSPDTVDEPDETVVVTLAEGVGYTVGTPAAVTGVIVNVPVLPTITLTVSPAAVKEDGAANLVYTFTRTGSTTNALTVNYGINGTAGNSDYTGATPGSSKMITFAAGSSTATLTIDPAADSTVEYDETVALTLATGIGYTVGTNAAVVGTITNDDSVVTLEVSPATVIEDGAANLVYTFTRTGFAADALTVNYTVGGTAFLGTDYIGIATPGTTKTVTFAAGAATAIVTVDPTADSIVETDETVEFTLAAGTGYTVGTRSAVVGTITNDDSTVTLAVSSARVTENVSTNLVYTFTRTGFTNNALTIDYTIVGTADSSDYTGATPGTDKTITFAAGSTTATLTIDPSPDTVDEPDETVVVTLAEGSGYTVGTPAAVTGVIVNVPVLPTITLTVSPAAVKEDGAANLVYTFTRTGSTTSSFTVKYDLNGSAIDSDYTGARRASGQSITFAAGSSTATLTIDPTADTGVETDETIAVTLVAEAGYTVATTTAVVGTITNDDVTSAVTATLAANQSSLTLTGKNAINGTGSALNNTIIGNKANNVLDGKDGLDFLTGAEGADTFLFSTAPTYGASTADRITDFNAAQGDILQINKSAFGMASSTNNSTTVVSTADLTAAMSTTNTFVYDSTSGYLYWNQNGATPDFGIGGIFAVLNNKTALTSSNIQLV